MGLRSRLKGRLKKLAGADPTPPAKREAPPRKPPAPPRTEPLPPPSPPATAAKPATPKATDCIDQKPVDETKVKRHREKAQRGVLKHLAKEGGVMSMKDLHDYSERRYFIAHAGFSKMMEVFVEDRYVDFDHDTYTVTITEDGRHYMRSAIPS